MLIPFATRPAHPMYWRLTPAVASPGLLLPGLVDRPDHQPAPPPARAVPPPSSPATANRRTTLIAAQASQRRVVQQPLRPVRRPVPGMPGDAPPVPPRQLADQRRHVLARLQPRLRPGKARPQQFQQLSPFPQRQPGAYPDGSSRLRFIVLTST